ncbi:unnamed protein product [Auanema sp. JU1783]|nr:unnamed protein product [Auanema sp. JU1783]
MRLLVVSTILLSVVACASAIKCYACNSLIQKDCTEKFEKYIMKCVPRKFGGSTTSVAPIGCRKTLQYASGESSVIRECAYFGEAEEKNQKGSLGVSRKFHQCTEDLCNSATSFKILLVPTVLIAFYNML